METEKGALKKGENNVLCEILQNKINKLYNGWKKKSSRRIERTGTIS